MGGSNTTTTNQASTYQPSPQAAGYITNALQNAQTASQAPFQQPVAPVAGFSPDQLAAFQTVNNAQGMANPYFAQASNLFGQSAQAPNVNQFFNPLAGAVGAQLQNLFGQQMSQTTGQLTQAAGGVGADRIAVGQGQLANQQGLAAGQTFAGLYQPALQAAQQEQNILQGAGYGYGALGPAAQNAVLSGAQAQLGTGGLQQQLSQAQLNAPYQQRLAQLAYPFQTSNFLSNATGALAPGLGGTTWGGGQTTLPAPSMLSQVGGLGLAGFAGLGASGAFGSNGWLTGTPALPYGSAIPGAQGPTSVGGAPLNYDRGGDVGYAEGGGPEVSDEPIDAEPQGGVVQQEQLAKIQPHIPQINLNPPQQSSGGKGSGMGDIASTIGSVAKIAAMFPANRGGRVGMGNPMFAEGYADAGTVGYDNPFDADLRQIGEMQLAHGWSNQRPDFIPSTPADEPAPATRGMTPSADFNNRFGEDTSIGPVSGLGGISPETAQNYPVGSPFNPYRMASPDAVAQSDAELKSRDADIGQSVAQNAPKVSASFAPEAPPPQASPVASPAASELASQPPSAPSKHGEGFANSQWLPLIAAGLGIAGGTSPFALQNIGQGGLTGLKVIEAQQAAEQKQQTIDQATERLKQEAKFHEDSFTRESVAQKNTREQQERQFNRQLQLMSLEAGKPFKVGQDKAGFDVMATRDPAHPGQFINVATGKSLKPEDLGNVGGGDGTGAAGAAGGAHDYSQGSPTIEQGKDVPEPVPIAGKSAGALKTDGEMFAQTGKLPPYRGTRGPLAVQSLNYRNAVENYGVALAESRGISYAQLADMQRSAPGMLRFILGPDGRTTGALGTAVRHLDTLQQLSEAFKGSNIPAIRRLQAVIQKEFGGDAVTNLETAGRIVGPEIVKAIGVAGAGTDRERESVAQGFAPGASTQQILGAIATTQKLLGGQLEGKERQAAAAGVSPEKFKGLIGDRPYQILHGQQTETAPAAAAGTAPPTVGEIRTNKHGVKGRWNGTGWEVIQ